MCTTNAQLKENQFDMVRDSQETFRKLMMSLAFPGAVQTLKSMELAVEPAAMGFVLQPLLTLLDLETDFHVHAHDATMQEEVTRYIEINTNSRSKEPEEADFILCLESSLDGKFARLKRGSLSHPDDSATVFYLVDHLTDTTKADEARFTLTGPGIKKRCRVSVTGLSPEELAHWHTHRKDYPMGIDIYLISRSGQLIGIPRSAELFVEGGN